MSVVERYLNPFNDVRRLEKEVADLFRSFDRTSDGFNSLPINIMENNDEYTVIAAVPGIDKEMIDIEATSQFLKIEIKRETKMEDEEETDKSKFIVREIKRNNLRRQISFDKAVNPQKAATQMKNGMLTITMPKMETEKSVKLEPELIEA